MKLNLETKKKLESLASNLNYIALQDEFQLEALTGVLLLMRETESKLREIWRFQNRNKT